MFALAHYQIAFITHPPCPPLAVTYALGRFDACNCNTNNYSNAPSCVVAGSNAVPNYEGPPGCADTAADDVSANKLDTGCSAMVEGSNRLQRGTIYLDYLAAITKVKPNSTIFAGACWGGPWGGLVSGREQLPYPHPPPRSPLGNHNMSAMFMDSGVQKIIFPKV